MYKDIRCPLDTIYHFTYLVMNTPLKDKLWQLSRMVQMVQYPVRLDR